MIVYNLLKLGVGVPMIRILIRSLVVGCLFWGTLVYGNCHTLPI